MRTKLWIVSALAGMALLGACSDGAGVAGPEERQDPLVEKLVGMGFDRTRIVDRGEFFIVEGDIVFDKKDLRAARPAGGKARPAAPLYQRYESVIAANRRYIRVNLSAVAAENTAWANATRAAMANWSNIPGMDLTMVEGAPADITVSFVDDFDDGAACTVGWGRSPINGAPGLVVQINRTYAADYRYAQMVWVMTHELGHNIGLLHTDWLQGTPIPGTPPSDAASVMNSGDRYPGCPPAAPDWSAFSYYDQVAGRYLYPLPSVTGLTSGNSGGTVLLSWNAVSGATSYEYQSYEYTHYSWGGTASHEGGWQSVSTPYVNTGSSFTGVSSCSYQDPYNETYFYWQVRAVFANGKRSTVASVVSNDAAC